MKSFKILIAAAAVTAVLFSGCQKEVFTGIDKSKAGVTDFTYDEIMSSPSTVSLVWNPSAAKTAGATSFSVQLAKKEDFSDVDMYEPSIGQTVMADATPNDGVVFSGLKEYDLYYARIRANYPRSVFSDWTVLKDGDELVCVSVGHGIVSMSFAAPKQIKLDAPAYSKIVASWSVVGKASGYAPEWKKSSDASWIKLPETTGAQVEIAELTEKTSYDVRVRAFRDNDGSKEYTDYVSGSVTTPAKPAFTPQIEDKDQLLTFFNTIAATAGSADSYTLEKDIDLEGAELPAVEAFAGKFDGKKHSIKNATVSDNLFGSVSGSIKDVTFSGFKLGNSLIAAATESASLSGIAFDKDCSVTFPEPADATNFGTLVATNAGSVEGCSNAAVIAVDYAALPKASCNWGGLVGYTTGVVKDCSNTGKMSLKVAAPASGTFHTFGGVVGMYEGAAGQSMVVGCSNKGDVSVEYKTAVYFYVGGVVGGSPSANKTPGNYGVIENCTNEGSVSMHYIDGGSGAYPNIGGVVGYTEGQLKGCINKGNISTACDSEKNTWTCTRIAGVGGTVTQGASDCHNFGTLSVSGLLAGGTAGNRGAGNIETSCFGGVIAAAGPFDPSNSVVFENCTNEVNLELNIGTTTETPNHHVGGVFGFVTGKIDNCQNKGNVNVTCPTAINRLGGIAGGSKCDVSNCTNTGNLKVVHAAVTKSDWRAFVGGITADVNKADSPVTYTKCVNSGALDFTSTSAVATSKTSAVGGIVGCGKSGVEITFTDCSNTGALSYSSAGACVTGDLRGGDYN